MVPETWSKFEWEGEVLWRKLALDLWTKDEEFCTERKVKELFSQRNKQEIVSSMVFGKSAASVC